MTQIATIAERAKVNSTIESWPCINAADIGRKLMKMAPGSHGQTPAKAANRGRSSRNETQRSATLKKRKLMYAILNGSMEKAANRSASYARWLNGSAICSWETSAS